MTPRPRLAIVVPAYKARFLDAALASLAAQSCQDFDLHVGDDASPEPIEAICARWLPRLPLHYHRFERNLGGDDLVAQWARCVALSSADWVWLFADDDLMPADGVARVCAAIAAEGTLTPLFHLDAEWIDGRGRPMRIDRRFAPRLGARQFALQRMRGQISSFASEYVFSRQAYERLGGFVRLPRGWCADDASWMQLSGTRGMRSLPGARVGWRCSGLNISANHGADRAAKLQAYQDYVAWLRQFLQSHPAQAGEPSDATLLRHVGPWLALQQRRLGGTNGAAATGAAAPGSTHWNAALAMRSDRVLARLGSACRLALRRCGMAP